MTQNPKSEIRIPKSLFDVVIVGAGPSGLACAIEAKKHQLQYTVLEKGCITNSILHFPTQMIFFTTPELLEIGGMPLVSDREKPTRNEGLKYYRKVPHVSHYYTEAHPFFNRDVVVIGGKNSAVETALDLFRGGARVSLVHRGAALGQTVKYWIRPDIENRFKKGEIIPHLNAKVLQITRDHVKIAQNGTTSEIPAQQVFALTGYHPSTKFFDQLGVQYDPDTLRPQCDPQTFETNVEGVYLAGSVIGGRLNGEIFIENGRFHGEALMKAVAENSGKMGT